MRYIFTCLICASFIGLSACKTIDMDAPSVVSENLLRVEEGRLQEEYSLQEVKDYAAGIADDYRRHGSGGLQVDVTYNPLSTSMSAAREQGRKLAAILRRNGVRDVQVSALPINGQKSYGALISYVSYEALAPEDCSMMPGYYSAHVVHDDDYKIGCSVETLFAQQVARPKDLAGVSGMDAADGRRAMALADVYRSGAANSNLSGESASKD